MRFLRTILLALVAAFCVTAAVFLTIEGNLSSIFGYYNAFSQGERLFPYSQDEINEISWMRIKDSQATAECARLPNGVWWMTAPWNDRMDPRAAAAILQYTYSTSIVASLPMNNTVKASMREFGVDTNPIEITLKKANFDGTNSKSMARYTLGSPAPWVVEDPNGQANATTYMRCDFYGKNDRILVGTGNILPLFKNSINQLRDHKPLLLPPDPAALMPTQAREITISAKKQKVTISRDSLVDPWLVTSPLALKTNQKNVTNLLIGLQRLTAVKVYDPGEWLLPDLPDSELTKITIHNFTDEEPVTLTIYPPDSPTATTARATVSNRKAVFEIILKTHESSSLPGLDDLPVTLSQLRTPYLMEIDRSKLRGISVSSPANKYPLIVRMLEVDTHSGIDYQWVYSAEGSHYAPASEEQLFNLLKALVASPVAGFASDDPKDLDMYGLRDPEYIINVAYDQKDEAIEPQTLFIGLGSNDEWYAMEYGKSSVYQLSPEFLASMVTDELSWKPRKLLSFSRINLKSIDIDQEGKPSVTLFYDHLDDSWDGKTKGTDELLNVNPTRARNYLTGLEKLKVKYWLSYSNTRAAEALKNPIFELTLHLEEQADQGKKLTIISEEVAPGASHLPVPTDDSVKRQISIQVAPVSSSPGNNTYYGRISTSPYYFVLDASEFMLLKASVVD